MAVHTWAIQVGENDERGKHIIHICRILRRGKGHASRNDEEYILDIGFHFERTCLVFASIREVQNTEIPCVCV